MDVVTLLDRATSAGLRLSIAGDDLVIRGPRSAAALVAEIGRRKAEILAALGDGPGAVPDWSTLCAQRWAGADESPGIDIPVDAVLTGRYVARSEPDGPDRGDAWVGDLAEGDSSAPGETPATQPSAGAVPGGLSGSEGDDVVPGATAGGWPEVPPPIEGFELLPESEWPDWAFDESMLITIEAIRASAEHDRATRQAMVRHLRATKRDGRDAGKRSPEKTASDPNQTV